MGRPLKAALAACRLQMRVQRSKLARLLATCCSHFATLRSGGTKPESSPPNGPPATAATTGRKSRALEGRCMQSPGTHRYVKLDASVHVLGATWAPVLKGRSERQSRPRYPSTVASVC